MTILRTYVFLALVFIGLSGPISAQDWQATYNQALTAFNEGDFVQAISIGEAALALAEDQFGVDSEAFSYSAQILSVASYESGQFEKGIRYSLQEIESNRLRNTHDTIYVKSLRNLVLNYQGAGQPKSAIPVSKEMLSIHLQYYGAKSLLYNLSLSDLANAELAAGNPDTALVLFERANESLQSLPDGGEEYINNLYQIGVIKYQQGQVEESMADLSYLRSILEDNGLKEEFIYGQTQEQMGSINYARGNFDQAERCYVLAIAVYNLYYSNPMEYQAPLVDLAAIYLKKGQKTQSDSILRLLPDAGPDSNIIINQINLASTKYQEGSLAESLRLYNEILSSPEYEKLNDENLKAEVITNYANLNLESENYQEALRAAKHITPFYRQVSNPSKLAGTLNIRGRAYDHLGKADSARMDHQEAYGFLNQLAISEQVVVVSGLMEHYYTHGQLEEAKNVYSQIQQNAELSAQLQYTYALVVFGQGNLIEARDILQTLPSQELRVKITLGVISLELDDFNGAENYFKEIRSILEQNGMQESVQFAENLINLGRLNLYQGNYPEAEVFYLHGLEIMTSNASPAVSLANGFNAVAIFYQTLGNYEAALEYYIQAKSVYHDNSTELADLLQNMATLYQLIGQEDQSISLLNDALRIYESALGDQHPHHGNALQNLASAYKKQDLFDKSEPLYKKALAIDLAVYGENHHSTATKVHNLAVLYQENDRYQESLELFQRVLSIRKELLGEHHPDYIYSLYGLAVLYHRMGEIEKAKPTFDLVIDEYLHQVRNYFEFLSEKEKSAFYHKVKPVFGAYHDFAIEFSETDPTVLADLFNLHMTTKAILLSTSNMIRRSILESGDSQLIDEFQRWTVLKEEIIRAYGLAKDQLADADIDIRALELEANNIEKELSLKSAEFTNTQIERSPTWLDIQGKLNGDEAIVEMLRIRKNIKNDSILYVAFVITRQTKGHPQAIIMQNGSAMEDRWFRGYINTMRYQIKSPFGYDHFWQPIAALVEDKATIYFSPDGIYNKINLNTLRDPADSRYLLEKVDIRYLTKASQILLNTDRAASPPTARLFGYPDFGFNATARNTTRYNRIIELPGTKLELEQLEDIFSSKNWDSKAYIQESATEQNLKENKDAKVLHIATHGFFFENVPSTSDISYHLGENPLLRCGLLLTGSQESFKGDRIVFNTQSGQEDGILTAYEVMNLDLRGTELVVLSACETALGEVENGEGVYGLQRAFIAAGAETIVMSLWKVDDFATQELMVNFYQHYLNGDTKFVAFAKAQKMIQSKYVAPYFWGAFIMNGI